MSSNISNTLHAEAYEIFRYHLNQTYAHKNASKVYGMSVGYPAAGEFELPIEILTEMMPIVDGHEKPRAGYGWEAGSLPVREAIIEYENVAHDASYTLKNVCIVAGATYGFNRILEHLFTDEGLKDGRDELLVVSPNFYRMLSRAPSYVAKVVSVSASEEHEFQATVEEIIGAIRPSTKAVFLLNPSNPTYLYYDNEFLDTLIAYLAKRKIYLIIDESGDAYVSGVSKNYNYHKMSPNIANPYVIRIVTASKKYQLAEFRIGYILAGKQFIGTKEDGFIKLIGDDMSNPPLAANDAWLAILRHEINTHKGIICANASCDFVAKQNQATQKITRLRDIALSELQSMKHVGHIIVPDANFNLAFCFKTDKALTDKDIFDELIDVYHVALVPCSGLGIDPKLRYFRLTYAIREQELRDGLAAIRRFTECDYL